MKYQVIFEIPVIIENCESERDAVKKASLIIMNTYEKFIPSLCCATIKNLESKDTFFYHAGLSTYENISNIE